MALQFRYLLGLQCWDSPTANRPRAATGALLPPLLLEQFEVDLGC